MPEPLLPPHRAQSPDGPPLIAAAAAGPQPRATAMHRHARGQLLGSLRGLLSVDTGDGLWIVPAAQAIWLPPDVPHGLRSHGPFAGWSVYLAPQACAGLPDTACVLQSSELLRAAVMRAAAGDGRAGPAQDRLAGVILDEIQSLPRSSPGLPMPRDPRLLRIAQALADDPADPRRLDEWACWAAIAPRTLIRRYAHETGLSFGDWRQRLRLMRALEMLAAGKAVTTVALDLGYDNVSAFIAMFRRAYGTTPARYFDQPPQLPPPAAALESGAADA
ncbi:helix-turn-helix domain-containing protein [Bordetella sp. BOR01]|uniref:AraC family transcriptional regulator n=1 Tax=Bordetella sp. BOR01 TaxID=2854779 RepID=UPI001C43F71B|nr:helix-turn-helix transcriptional regulator [Bordetella sp. BOR01]MBV7482651.1 helix-turn-helix transcriptional regulator [Bordetella sp. BOR01]